MAKSAAFFINSTEKIYSDLGIIIGWLADDVIRQEISYAGFISEYLVFECKKKKKEKKKKKLVELQA